jgi:hypothetical protein
MSWSVYGCEDTTLRQSRITNKGKKRKMQGFDILTREFSPAEYSESQRWISLSCSFKFHHVHCGANSHIFKIGQEISDWILFGVTLLSKIWLSHLGRMLFIYLFPERYLPLLSESELIHWYCSCRLCSKIDALASRKILAPPSGLTATPLAKKGKKGKKHDKCQSWGAHATGKEATQWAKADPERRRQGQKWINLGKTETRWRFFQTTYRRSAKSIN